MQTRHIEGTELQLDESQYLGIGTYGLVKRGVWRGKHIAVKYLRQVRDKPSFIRELRQLCICDHDNIVKIFGANKEENFFVMEFADCGTLCKVMHSTHEVHYTISHVVKWAVQLGMAVAYLHSQKPRPIVHRDLKPLNLLLFQAGRVLKLCDFGTARTADSFMSNLKGTCLWMAPEVCGPKDTSGPLARYSEKCDIFSWGIILWEMLARKRPYSADFEMRDTIKIMLHVVLEQGRPRPLIGCPPELNDLITSCWAQSPEERPSMDDCVRLLSMLIPHLPGYDDPLDMPGMPNIQDTEPSVTEEPPLATVSRQDTEEDEEEVEEVVVETGDDQTQKEAEEEGKMKTPGQELSRSWEVVVDDRNVLEKLSHAHPGAQELKEDGGLRRRSRSRSWELIDHEELSPFQMGVMVRPELQAMEPVPGNSLSRSVYASHLDLLRRYEGLLQDIAVEEQKKHDVDRKLRESCNDNDEWIRMEEYMNMMLQIEEINNSQNASAISNGL